MDIKKIYEIYMRTKKGTSRQVYETSLPVMVKMTVEAKGISDKDMGGKI